MVVFFPGGCRLYPIRNVCAESGEKKPNKALRFVEITQDHLPSLVFRRMQDLLEPSDLISIA
jgi:hypothetical protein